MNYVIYAYYIFRLFVFFSSKSTFLEQTRMLEIYFGVLGVFCTINCYFEYRIWILCIYLYMGTYFEVFF